jgi:hypothetical protein
MPGCLVKDELGRMWKESVVAEFEVIYRHLLEGTKENHENHENPPI